MEVVIKRAIDSDNISVMKALSTVCVTAEELTVYLDSFQGWTPSKLDTCAEEICLALVNLLNLVSPDEGHTILKKYNDHILKKIFSFTELFRRFLFRTNFVYADYVIDEVEIKVYYWSGSYMSDIPISVLKKLTKKYWKSSIHTLFRELINIDDVDKIIEMLEFLRTDLGINLMTCETHKLWPLFNNILANKHLKRLFEYAIQQGFDVNCTCDAKSSPLISLALFVSRRNCGSKSAENRYEAIAQMLIEAGADINFKFEGRTAVEWAVYRGVSFAEAFTRAPQLPPVIVQQNDDVFRRFTFVDQKAIKTGVVQVDTLSVEGATSFTAQYVVVDRTIYVSMPGCELTTIPF